MDILWRDVFQVVFIDVRAALHVVRHLRRSGDIRNCQLRRGFEQRSVVGFAGELSPGCFALPLGVYLFDLLDGFKQSGASGYAVSLERWRYRKADGFFRATGISDKKVRRQRVKSALYAFNG